MQVQMQQQNLFSHAESLMIYEGFFGASIA
jgi:hypothetical protein